MVELAGIANAEKGRIAEFLRHIEGRSADVYRRKAAFETFSGGGTAV